MDEECPAALRVPLISCIVYKKFQMQQQNQIKNVWKSYFIIYIVHIYNSIFLKKNMDFDACETLSYFIRRHLPIIPLYFVLQIIININFVCFQYKSKKKKGERQGEKWEKASHAFRLVVFFVMASNGRHSNDIVAVAALAYVLIFVLSTYIIFYIYINTSTELVLFIEIFIIPYAIHI